MNAGQVSATKSETPKTEIIDAAMQLAQKLDAVNLNKTRRANKNQKLAIGGLHSLAKPGGGNDFWQFRESNFGEDIRKIDWRKSAKTDKIIVKEHETQLPLFVQFWVDNRANMNWASVPNIPTKGEFALTIGLALAYYLRANQETIGFVNHKASIRKASAFYQIACQSGLELPNKVKKGRAILFTDGFDDIETWQTIIETAKQSQTSLLFVFIHDKEEIEFNFDGRVQFTHDKTQTEAILIDDCQSIAGQYRAQFAAHFDTLFGILKRNNIEYLQSKSDADPFEIAHKICSFFGDNDNSPRGRGQ